jgi:hypothetical protein
LFMAIPVTFFDLQGLSGIEWREGSSTALRSQIGEGLTFSVDWVPVTDDGWA